MKMLNPLIAIAKLKDRLAVSTYFLRKAKEFKSSGRYKYEVKQNEDLLEEIDKTFSRMINKEIAKEMGGY